MTLINIAKEKTLRRKAYFTIFVLAITSLLTEVPTFGVNSDFLESIFTGTNITSFVDSLSGGALSQLSIASFGISSYITATIVIQLLTIVFPKLEQIRMDGERGQMRLRQIEFFLAMFITITNGLALSISFGNQGLLVEYSPLYVAIAVLSWTVGSLIVIGLSLMVENRGLGNGVSLVLCFNILSRIPNNVVTYLQNKIIDKDFSTQLLWGGGFVLALIVFLFITMYMQCGMLNIPLIQSKKDASIMNRDGRLPIGANVANVLPIIYASTLFAIPEIISLLIGEEAEGNLATVLSALESDNWYNPTTWYHVAGLAAYILVTIGFAFFASGLTFNSIEIAYNMRMTGDVIPGVQPGNDTVTFLERRRKIMTTINVIFLLALTIIPDFICAQLDITEFSFFGTSLMIIIAIFFDTALRLRAVSIHNDKQFGLFPLGKKGVAA